MKKLLIVITFICVHLSLYSQTVPTPEFSSRPYILDQSGSLINMERADAIYEEKYKALGYGGSDCILSVSPTKSNMRFKIGSFPKLIIKVDNNTDPSELFTLAAAKKSRNKREFVLSNKAYLTNRKRHVKEDLIELRFQNIHDGIYEIILPDNIEPGEYAFIPNSGIQENNSQKIKLTCFGID